jgi:hypothetical protein
MPNLEQQFTQAMFDIYRGAKTEAGYNAIIFLQHLAAISSRLIGEAGRATPLSQPQTGRFGDGVKDMPGTGWLGGRIAPALRGAVPERAVASLTNGVSQRFAPASWQRAPGRRHRQEPFRAKAEIKPRQLVGRHQAVCVEGKPSVYRPRPSISFPMVFASLTSTA